MYVRWKCNETAGMLSTSDVTEGLTRSPNIVPRVQSRRLLWAHHSARIGEIRNADRILVWKPLK
jgi:hypothetical protein